MSKSDNLYRYQWMGDAVTPAQLAILQSVARALDEASKGDDPGMAEHALRVEGARRDRHVAVGGRVPPMEGVTYERKDRLAAYWAAQRNGLVFKVLPGDEEAWVRFQAKHADEDEL